MRYIASIIAVALGLFSGEAAARSDIDQFRNIPWGASVDTVRRYFNLIGPTDIGGKVDAYVSPESTFGDLYGDLIFNFYGGKLVRFRAFLGVNDSGDRFRAVLRVMNASSGWSQLYLKTASTEIPLLVKPVVNPFKPPSPPPRSFSEAQSVWIEAPVSEDALLVYKRTASYRDVMNVITGKSTALRGVIITLHKGFVSATFAPARDLIREIDQAGEGGGESAQPSTPDPSDTKDLDMLKPLAPK